MAFPLAAFLAAFFAPAFLTVFLVNVGAVAPALIGLDFAAAFLRDFLGDGPFSASHARRPASSSNQRSIVIASRVSPRRNVAFVSPSETYIPKRPSLIMRGL